uniref:transcription termination factor MTERF8, chloroplastic n=1 Tax=Erigeron canadensis TaxID=72917 RepID=UPI001CB99916|nr:transcription termination factor MTERF8, chloroplastic [Erigeron canadensis]
MMTTSCPSLPFMSGTTSSGRRDASFTSRRRTPLTPFFYAANPQQQQLRLGKPPRLFRCSATSVSSSSSTSTTTTGTGTPLFSLLLEIGMTLKATEALFEYLKFQPFESIRTQIHSLQNLGIHGPLLTRLIRKRPNLLIAPQVHSLLAFLSTNHLLLDGATLIEPAQLARLLSATDPLYLSGFEAKVHLLLDLGIPLHSLPHVLNNLNLSKALCIKSSQDIHTIISFLNRFGGMDLILRRPAILNFDLDTQLVPRIEFFLNMSGGDEAATTTVLLKLPFILAYSVQHYTNHVHFFRSFAGLTDDEIFKIILVYPSLFSASQKRKLQPRIEFLKQCGFTSNEIYKLLVKAPLFLSLSFEDNLSHKLVLLLKIGYEHRTKELGLAMGWVCRTSCKNMQEVISLFLNYGLTCEEILAMGKKHPQVLQYNHKSMKQKMDYLTEDMGYEVREMLAFPAFLGYGFHGRIKHRFEASGKISGEGVSINKLFSMSTARFSKKQEQKLPVTITKSR